MIDEQFQEFLSKRRIQNYQKERQRKEENHLVKINYIK